MNKPERKILLNKSITNYLFDDIFNFINYLLSFDNQHSLISLMILINQSLKFMKKELTKNQQKYLSLRILNY